MSSLTDWGLLPLLLGPQGPYIYSESDCPQGVPMGTIKQKCVNFYRGPNLIRSLIIVICLGIVIQQVILCVKKIMNKPITTYTHFDFNKTILYPSVTLCREPPYKYDKLLEYGLYYHPRLTSTWSMFNFSGVDLDQLWQDITYDAEEIFVEFSLDGRSDNLELESTLGFMYGRCYTLSPKIISRQATKATGYSIKLQHSADDVATASSISPPGYHVHLHYHREPFTEVHVYNGGQVDYIYVNIGDTLDVKLKVEQYVKISAEDDPCTHMDNYSANECTTQFVWDQSGNLAGCSGPWMNSNLPYCNSYRGMRELISAYMTFYNKPNCSICPRFCRSYLYNSFVNDRQSFYSWDSVSRQWAVRTGDATLQSQLYIYFNGMVVTVYEERYNYDWSLFLSDLGGSIGFLLGLSVISLMTICGNIWRHHIKPSIKPKNKTGTSNSTTTLNQTTKYEEYLKNYTEWNF
ncbi:degenerin-like protein asic-1 [Achroia grisella]|uniref:degenerin-like protein asic-1 n=1 Tax=Achroia grisella TaxID=688607 RepID=UPI0027D2DF0E|nr:degenerin-like protein asic-1 [Achroia grisella]